MKTYEVTVKGTCDLLMHKFSVEQEAELDNTVKKKKQHNKTKEAEAEEVAYRMEDGRLFLPAEHFYQSMCRAASGFQIKGQGKKTYKDNVKGGVIINPEYIPFPKKQEYEIDSRPVRIQRARVIRHRPKIAKGWILEFEIGVLDEDLIPEEVLSSILERAGQQFAVGDYRPRFGRFMTVKFQEKNGKS